MNWFCMAHDHPDPVLIKTKWCVNMVLHLVIYKFHFWRSLVLIKHRLLIYNVCICTCHMYVNKINERTHFTGTWLLICLKTLLYLCPTKNYLNDSFYQYRQLDELCGPWYRYRQKILVPNSNFFSFDPFYRAERRLVMSVTKCSVSVVDWQNTSICTCIQY
jgi:hypothetical protein